MATLHTVCVKPVGLVTYNIACNDADYAASIGADCISPFQPGSPADREWVRHYNQAKQGIRISGYTPCGRQRNGSGR